MAETNTVEVVELKSQFDINRKDFLQFCEAISVLTEDATITLAEDGAYAGVWGLSCKTMDPTHVSLVDAYLGKIFNVTPSLMQVGQFAVRTDELKKVVKTMKADNITITLKLNSKEMMKEDRSISDTSTSKKNKGIDTIELSSDDQSTELRMADAEKESTPMPAIKWSWRGLFDTKEFLAMLRLVDNVSDYITLTATNDGISYSGKGDSGKTSGVLKKDPDSDRIVSQGLVNGKIEGTYSTEYLLPMFRVLKDGKIRLALGEGNKPCLVTYENLIQGGIITADKRIKYYLAPRVG